MRRCLHPYLNTRACQLNPARCSSFWWERLNGDSGIARKWAWDECVATGMSMRLVITQHVASSKILFYFFKATGQFGFHSGNKTEILLTRNVILISLLAVGRISPFLFCVQIVWLKCSTPAGALFFRSQLNAWPFAAWDSKSNRLPVNTFKCGLFKYFSLLRMNCIDFHFKWNVKSCFVWVGRTMLPKVTGIRTWSGKGSFVTYSMASFRHNPWLISLKPSIQVYIRVFLSELEKLFDQMATLNYSGDLLRGLRGS